MIRSKKYIGEHTQHTAPSIYHVNDLIQEYNRVSAGHFFDPETMRFFKSKVIEYFRGDMSNTGYFITSERFDHNTPRMYTVRRVERVKADNFYGYTYDITTVEDFQAYKSSNAAKKAIERILKNEVKS